MISLNKKREEIAKLIKIPSPPIVGIDVLFIRRLLGLSTAPILNASSRIKGVKIMDIKKVIKSLTIKVKVKFI